VTAKKGKVKVQGEGDEAEDRRVSAVHALDVRGLSELGKGVGALIFKSFVGYRYSGLAYAARCTTSSTASRTRRSPSLTARFCGNRSVQGGVER
jgi:hypothetical protein